MSKTPASSEFLLKPIGYISVTNGAFVQIFPDYTKALKALEMFSHAILVYKPDENHRPILPTVPDDSKDLLWLQHRIVLFSVVKLLYVDNKRGVVAFDGLPTSTGTWLFDIKPYFPCEDRVRELKIPNRMRSWGEWRTEQKDIMVHNSGDIHFCPPALPKESLSMKSLGQIRHREGKCRIELMDPDKDYLKQLMEFSHIKVVWWFHKFDKPEYRRTTQVEPPYENAPKTGIFATRSPVRPNPIALSTVRILDVDVERGIIHISGSDALDQSPVIDIVPYIPVLDRVEDCTVPEWLKHWPVWLDDRERQYSIEENTFISSDMDRLRKYLDSSLLERQNAELREVDLSHVEETVAHEIRIMGARQNNLKSISCSIPKNKLTVITGVSGSGKSSLAFDTLFAESQRRFMDSMSTAGRAVFEPLEKPDVRRITGLPPAVAIEQKTVGRNPRSTVGTMTDLYDYLKLLFTAIGRRHCPECGKAVIPLKGDEIVDVIQKIMPGTSFGIRGYNQLAVAGQLVAPQENEEKNSYYKTLRECVIQALSAGRGAIILCIDGTEEFLLQTKEMCFPCNRVFFELTASTFSFNHPESMCPICKGLGVQLSVDPQRIVEHPEKSILDNASSWWGNLRKHREKPNANWMRGEILALAEEMGVDLELPWASLSEDFRKQALYGSDGREVRFIYQNTNGRKGEIVRPVEGACHTISRLFKENNGATAQRLASAYMRESLCSSCEGERLTAEGRMVAIAGTRFPQTVGMTVDALRTWVIDLPQKISEDELKICGEVLNELKKRLENLIEVGVPYLTMDRAVPTLSGGEAQRLRLAAQLGSGITDILYVLDEPSVGLHPYDHEKLIKLLKKLKDAGNTVVVVEHDADMMMNADKIIDIGPGAGVHGGWITAEGTPEELMENKASLTGAYLSSIKQSGHEENILRKPAASWIRITGACHNNLKNIDVSIPLGVLVCVTGVSGSGKSSLITKTLYPALTGLIHHHGEASERYASISGMENIDQTISITQQPIGRTPRSNPATYTGVFEDIRRLFAALNESKEKGYRENKFSFNSKEGQCEACSGEGRRCIEMHFMPDVWVECTVCHGKRYNTEALEVKYNGKTIADVLDMNVEEAFAFFQGTKKISKVLQTLCDVGLGYIKLGQSALTLSGGEAQRIKLAKELSREDTGRTIYLLDEPTTGLHYADVQNLLILLRRMTQAGNTVLLIEHNIDVIKHADWIIDMGPKGGDDGGYIIAQGYPEDVAKVEGSYTGQHLKRYLNPM